MSMSPRWPSRTTLKRPRTEATKADLEPVVDEPATELVAPPAGSAAIATGVYPCRYAGAMMLYPYLHLVGAQAIFATCTGGPARRYGDLGVLTTAALGFALGAGTVEAAKHLRRAEAGAAVGLALTPELGTLRARLSAFRAPDIAMVVRSPSGA
jgi:hypothetical protein